MYGMRVPGTKPSLSLGFDRHYTYISTGADTDEQALHIAHPDGHMPINKHKFMHTLIHLYQPVALRI